MELFISGPDGSSKVVELRKDRLSLGRSGDNDLAYPEDPWLSRYHLCFEREQERWLVKDCASRNGTILNTTALKQPHQVKPGDKIYAGHLIIEVREPVAKPPKTIVSFVPPSYSGENREATIVRSLDEALHKTSTRDVQRTPSSLNNARVVQSLIRAGQELAAHRPLDQLFTLILDLALSAVEAKRGVILTLEGSELLVRASKGDGFSISTAVRDLVLREKRSQMVRDAQADAALRGQKSIVTHRVRSMMAAPLQAGDRVIGLIYVDNGAVIRPFSVEDLDLLTVMANVAAIRIENARLAAVEEAEKLMLSELAQASEIQQGLLPTEAPVYPGYDLAGFNLPCRTVGGDYYDFLPYRDGRLGLVVADVSGKGLPAALMMSSLQARVQMLLETNPDPAPALKTLNRNLAERCPLGRFITLFYGLLNPSTGALTYANAGHNHPVLIRRNGQIEYLTAEGMIMGLLPSVTYQSKETSLETGDLLALYSDGVTEARSAAGEEFGEERLAEFLLQRRAQPCLDTVRALLEYVRAWHSDATLTDDFTVVLLRRL
jgi:phosphoserine phosphatase RsbU/P